MKKRICRNCEHWKQYRAGGRCSRFPPFQTKGDGLPVWPTTLPDEHCGEWKQQEELDS